MTVPTGLPYRPCVGIMLVNRDGLVFVGRRISKWEKDLSANMWQMPQGGIDRGETPEQAAWRELREEVGTDRASLIGEIGDWLTYDLPSKALGIALKGKYRGQKQKWFAMRFEGEDRDIDISGTDGDPAEFDAWKWLPPGELGAIVVPFKRRIYERVVAEFSHLTA